MNLDFERDIVIDENALDVEWLEQPRLALKYGKYLVQTKAEVRRLEQLKKTVKAELILEATEKPEECCKKPKPTIQDIESYYRRHPRYKEVVEELNKALEEMEFAEIAFKEIAITRKKALEELVELFGLQYFAGPKEPRNLSEEAKKRREISKKISEKLNREEEDVF